MSNIFKRHEAYFLKKDQIAPNALIFNEELSDQAVRLLLVLNGLPDTWTPVQTDLENRLRWNRKKMTRAIQECVHYGYVQVHQRRGKKGQFAYNVFEFHTSPCFLKNAPTDSFQPCADFVPRSNPSDPPRQNAPEHDFQPCAKTPCAVNDSLACSFIELQETTTEQEQPVVVVPPLSKEEQLKIDALKPFDFDPITEKALMTFSINQIEDALAAFRQYENTNPVSNVKGWIRNAIMNAWKPNTTKADKDAQNEEDKLKKAKEKEVRVKQIILKAQDEVEKVQHLFRFQEGYNVSFGTVQFNSDLCHLRYADGRSASLHLVDDNSLRTLQKFLREVK